MAITAITSVERHPLVSLCRFFLYTVIFHKIKISNISFPSERLTKGDYDYAVIMKQSVKRLYEAFSLTNKRHTLQCNLKKIIPGYHTQCNCSNVKHIHILTKIERQGIVVGGLFLFSSLQFSVFSKLFVGRINVFCINWPLLILLSQRQSVYVVPGASPDHQACCHQAQILSAAHAAAGAKISGDSLSG